MFSAAAYASGHELHKDDIEELYYMCDITNLNSILTRGILSHARAAALAHTDVSNGEVQNLRANKYLERVDPDKKALSVHEHAVLYINAHNAMMHNIRDKNICVLRISKSLLNRGDVVISNRNAATHAADFYTADAFRLSPTSTGMIISSKALGFDKALNEKRIKVRQAEVLAPYMVQAEYIIGIIVPSEASKTEVAAITAAVKPGLPIKILPSLFYKGAKFAPVAPYSPIAGAASPGVTLPDSDSEGEIHAPTVMLTRPVAALAAHGGAGGGAAAPAHGGAGGTASSDAASYASSPAP
jgi:hypothetical protein